MKQANKSEDKVQRIVPESILMDKWPEHGNFDKFKICQKQIDVLKENKVEFLFPIQFNTYEYIFQGRDLIGKDRTGSGKTLAFSLPLIEQKRQQKKFKNKEGQKPLILVILPTRELAVQVEKQFFELKLNPAEYRTLCIYGGTKYDFQKSTLRNGVEIVVGTPGRLKDFLKNEYLSLESLEAIILDETDELLKMGFQKDIEEIVNQAPINFKQKGQFLMFSATVPDWVQKSSEKYMKDDKIIIDMVDSQQNQSATTLDHHMIQVDGKYEKYKCIPKIIKEFTKDNRTIIFSNTKNVIEDIAQNLKHSGLKLDVLSGDVKQYQRERVLQQFKDEEIQILVATDVAARGIHVDNLDLIIQFSPPSHYEQYIHRSGRTGRAGRKGSCVTLVQGNEYKEIIKIKQQYLIEFNRLQKYKFLDGDQQSKSENKSSKYESDNEKKQNYHQKQDKQYAKKRDYDDKSSKNHWKKSKHNEQKEDRNNNYKDNRNQHQKGWKKNNKNDDRKNNYKNDDRRNKYKNDDRKNNHRKEQNGSYLKKRNYNDDNDCEYEKLKVFVFNLPYDIDEDELKEFFSDENYDVDDIYLLKKDGEFKGQGFVTFGSSADAKKALDSQLKVKGRIIRIMKAKKRARN